MNHVNIGPPRYGRSVLAALPLLKSALDHYGVETPEVLVEAEAKHRRVLGLAETRRDHADLAELVGTSSLEDLDTVLDAAAQEFNRRTAALALVRDGLMEVSAAELSKVLTASIPGIWKKVRSHVAKDVKVLTAHSPMLPSNPLDPAEVLKGGSASAYTAIEPVLIRLGGVLNGLPTPASSVPATLPVEVARLLYVVAPVDLGPREVVGRYAQSTDTEDVAAMRTALATFRTDVQHDRRAALVQVARGGYGDALTLDVATDLDAVVERARQFVEANVTVQAA